MFVWLSDREMDIDEPTSNTLEKLRQEQKRVIMDICNLYLYSWSHAKLQGSHTQYKDEGDYPQQSTKKVDQFEMGSKRKYHKNNSIGIMPFCGCVRSTSLGEII